MRRFAVVAVMLFLVVAAAPKKKSTPPRPVVVAPSEVAHSMALFLKELSNNGARQVTFRATAVGTKFFLEETSGVTVYQYHNGRYVKVEFLRGTRLATAVKKHSR